MQHRFRTFFHQEKDTEHLFTRKGAHNIQMDFYSKILFFFLIFQYLPVFLIQNDPLKRAEKHSNYLGEKKKWNPMKL